MSIYSVLADFKISLIQNHYKKLAKRVLTETTSSFDLTKISEGKILNYGHYLIKKLWDKFQFDEFFKSVSKQF